MKTKQIKTLENGTKIHTHKNGQVVEIIRGNPMIHRSSKSAEQRAKDNPTIEKKLRWPHFFTKADKKEQTA